MDNKRLWKVSISLDGSVVFDRVLVKADSIVSAIAIAETEYKKDFKDSDVRAVAASIADIRLLN